MESCSCACDGTGPSVYCEREVTARKAHVCCECGEPIEPGQRYLLSEGCWDGHWSRYRTCVPCARIGKDLCCGRYCLGGLRELLWELLDFDYVTGRERSPPRRPLS